MAQWRKCQNFFHVNLITELTPLSVYHLSLPVRANFDIAAVMMRTQVKSIGTRMVQ